MHRFYAPALSADSTSVELPEDEAHHLSRVLRLKRDDVVAVFDGRGLEMVGRVSAVGARGAQIDRLERHRSAPEAAVDVTLAQALLKSDKMDRVIRDAVMLGVSAIQPLVSARTEVPRAAFSAGGRLERWQRTVVSSTKQCGRAVVPPVLVICDFGELLTRSDGARIMFVEPGIAHVPVTSLTALETTRPVRAALIIGPEGGWDPLEIDAAAHAGVTLVTLGSRILRADAAGAAALAMLRYIWRDL